MRRGCANPWQARLEHEAEWLGSARVRGELYDLGRYPGFATRSRTSSPVFGDLYRLRESRSTLAWLDRYEGCAPRDRRPHEYRRIRLRVRDALGRERLAWVYVLNHTPGGARLLPGGDFLARRGARRRAAVCATGVLRIIQLTDLHLFEHDQGWLDWHDDCRHVNTHATLHAVLADIKRLEPCIDAIIVTGDIAQSPTETTYRRVAEWLAEAGVPVFCLPGNHDDPATLRRCLAGAMVSAPEYVVLGRWLFVLLDSSVAGQSGGELSRARIEAMEGLLRTYADRNAALFLHHPPEPVGSAWLDRMGLANGAELMQHVSRFHNIKAIFFGHIHQEFDAKSRNIRLHGTPAACVQFLPRCAEHFYDRLPPGYRWIEFFPDGRIETGVRYVHRNDAESASALALNLR